MTSAQQAIENRKKLISIINTIILCGRQYIPLRGHNDFGEFSLTNEPNFNDGILRAILRSKIESSDKNLIKV